VELTVKLFIGLPVSLAVIGSLIDQEKHPKQSRPEEWDAELATLCGCTLWDVKKVAL